MPRTIRLLHGGTSDTALVDGAAWLVELDEIQRELAVAPTVPRGVAHHLWYERDQFQTYPAAFEEIDPYVALAFLGGALRCLKALNAGDRRTQRRELRVAVEQLRQALRDAIAGEAVSSNQPVDELARWLGRTLQVSVGDVAGVVGVSSRTFCRWMQGVAAPKKPNPLACMAQATNELRHVFTGPGVIGWFARPSVDPAGENPSSPLRNEARHPDLLRAARRYRAMFAD